MVMLSVRQRINGSYQGILFARDYIDFFPTFFLRLLRAKSRAASQLVRTMAGDSRNLLHTWLEYYISHHKPCFFFKYQQTTWPYGGKGSSQDFSLPQYLDCVATLVFLWFFEPGHRDKLVLHTGFTLFVCVQKTVLTSRSREK